MSMRHGVTASRHQGVLAPLIHARGPWRCPEQRGNAHPPVLGRRSGQPSVSVHVASVSFPGHQHNTADDGKDDAVLTHSELPQAGALPCLFGTRCRPAWEFVGKLGEEPICFRLVQTTQVAGDRPREFDPIGQVRFSWRPTRWPGRWRR